MKELKLKADVVTRLESEQQTKLKGGIEDTGFMISLMGGGVSCLCETLKNTCFCDTHNDKCPGIPATEKQTMCIPQESNTCGGLRTGMSNCLYCDGMIF